MFAYFFVIWALEKTWKNIAKHSQNTRKKNKERLGKAPNLRNPKFCTHAEALAAQSRAPPILSFRASFSGQNRATCPRVEFRCAEAEFEIKNCQMLHPGPKCLMLLLGLSYLRKNPKTTKRFKEALTTHSQKPLGSNLKPFRSSWTAFQKHSETFLKDPKTFIFWLQDASPTSRNTKSSPITNGKFM